jgi:hypothetical protein
LDGRESTEDVGSSASLPSTKDQRLELDEIVARHSAEQARLVKELLSQQDADQLMRQSR